MIKNCCLSILLIFGMISISFSQNTGDSFGDHLRYGGSFNLGFGNNYTTIGISPSAIYDFYNGFNAGMSLSYFYTENKNFNYKSNVFGGSIIGLYSPLPFMQISAELEELNVHYKDNIFDIEPYWVTGLYLGLAYYTGNVSIGIRYDLLYDINKSIYGSAVSPVFRLYF